MTTVYSRLAAVLTPLVLPLFIGQTSLRIGAAVICGGIAFALGVHWFRDRDREVRTGGAVDARTPAVHSADQGATVHQLSQQLREVVQHTETAALEINERVLSIIGRARGQLQAVTEVVNGLAREGNGGGAQGDLTRMIESLESETASLSRDVNGVILSLQFQDLTKQRLEQVIRELHLLHDELELLRTHRIDAADDALRTMKPDARSGRPEGPGEQGGSDG